MSPVAKKHSERMNEATTCTIHTKMMDAAMGGKRYDYDGKIPATHKVKRMYPNGDFHIMFTCDSCLSTLHSWAGRYDFTIEVDDG